MCVKSLPTNLSKGLIITYMACQSWSVLMKILTWFLNQGAKCWAHRNPFKTWLIIQLKSKIYPLLQNTPTGAPRVSKNSQNFFTNKSVEFLLEISWNNIEKLKKGKMKTKCFRFGGIQQLRGQNFVIFFHFFVT